MNQHICQAIREQRLIELEYKGHLRTIAPHVYGRDTTGDEMLSGYQTWGGSDSGEDAGWKSLKVKDISKLTVTTRRFGVRPEYRHGDRAMQEIFCQL